jgi:hypothetical protein
MPVLLISARRNIFHVRYWRRAGVSRGLKTRRCRLGCEGLGEGQKSESASSALFDFEATSRVFGSSVNLICNVSHTLSSARDICRIASGSKGSPARNGLSRVADLSRSVRSMITGKNLIEFCWNTRKSHAFRVQRSAKTRDFMPTKRTPEERHHWSLITERMGQQLKEYYRACTAEELPRQLLTLLKKLNQELPEEQDQ